MECLGVTRSRSHKSKVSWRLPAENIRWWAADVGIRREGCKGVNGGECSILRGDDEKCVRTVG